MKGKMMVKKGTCNGVLFLVILIISVLGASLCSASSLWASGGKVGYINLQRLVKESKMGKAASADIDRLREQKQAQITEKLRKINQIKIDLEANDELLKDEEKKDRIDSLNSLIKEYKRMVADAKEAIKKQDRDLVAEILKKADGALKKVAKKKKYDIILKDPNAIGFLNPDVDITDAVLKELNKG
ncbi:MAG: OmpH family outer membrane protein [Desulfobacter sp.]|nr:MAG: OmpH family outer membrane protein [Desulfobacter sp.]